MGKIKKALIKLSKKVTGKDLTNEDSIGDVVNFMADNYEGGSSTMMLDLDEIKEVNPDFAGIIDPNTVGCDAVKLFEYLSKGNTLAISYTDIEVPEEERKKGIFPTVETIYETDNVLRVSIIVGGAKISIRISKIEYPIIIFADSGEFIYVPGYGDVQNSFTCNKTYDEIIQMYEQGYNLYTITNEYEPVRGVFSEATKEGTLYHFVVSPEGRMGTYGIQWDDTNQVFVLWNGVM